MNKYYGDEKGPSLLGWSPEQRTGRISHNSSIKDEGCSVLNVTLTTGLNEFCM